MPRLVRVKAVEVAEEVFLSSIIAPVPFWVTVRAVWVEEAVVVIWNNPSVVSEVLLPATMV